MKVPITKEVLNYAATARMRYRAHLEEERRKTVTEKEGKKRKQIEEEVEIMKKKMKTLHDVCEQMRQMSLLSRWKTSQGQEWQSSSQSRTL